MCSIPIDWKRSDWQASRPGSLPGTLLLTSAMVTPEAYKPVGNYAAKERQEEAHASKCFILFLNVDLD